MVLAELASVRYICSNNLDRHYPSKIVYYRKYTLHPPHLPYSLGVGTANQLGKEKMGTVGVPETVPAMALVQMGSELS
jgi:hypothetical protein